MTVVPRIFIPNKAWIFFFPLLIICYLFHGCHSQVVVSIISRASQQQNAIKYISYCLSCPDPENEGSILKALNPKHGIKEYQITGEIVYCIPNHAEYDILLNDAHFQDRIVIVERGKITLLEKVLRIQDSEALGVIIIDSEGSCDEDFGYCSTHIGSAQQGGFAVYDDPIRWEEVEIPVVFITAKSGEKLRKLMSLQRLPVNGFGDQYITTISEKQSVPSYSSVSRRRGEESGGWDEL